MKPFNLEEALAGKKVVTRNGQEVTELHLFKNEEVDEPLVGIVDDSVHCWTKAGEYFDSGNPNLDIFMKKEKKQYWKNLFFLNGNIIISHASFPTESDALASPTVNSDHYIKTVLLHEEEE